MMRQFGVAPDFQFTLKKQGIRINFLLDQINGIADADDFCNGLRDDHLMQVVYDFGLTLLSLLRDVMPIMLILIGFQLFVLRKPIKNPRRVLAGMGLGRTRRKEDTAG
jgi:hypothetical protein